MEAAPHHRPTSGKHLCTHVTSSRHIRGSRSRGYHPSTAHARPAYALPEVIRRAHPPTPPELPHLGVDISFILLRPFIHFISHSATRKVIRRRAAMSELYFSCNCGLTGLEVPTPQGSLARAPASPTSSPRRTGLLTVHKRPARSTSCRLSSTCIRPQSLQMEF